MHMSESVNVPFKLPRWPRRLWVWDNWRQCSVKGYGPPPTLLAGPLRKLHFVEINIIFVNFIIAYVRYEWKYLESSRGERPRMVLSLQGDWAVWAFHNLLCPASWICGERWIWRIPGFRSILTRGRRFRPLSHAPLRAATNQFATKENWNCLRLCPHSHPHHRLLLVWDFDPPAQKCVHK